MEQAPKRATLWKEHDFLVVPSKQLTTDNFRKEIVTKWNISSTVTVAKLKKMLAHQLAVLSKPSDKREHWRSSDCTVISNYKALVVENCPKLVGLENRSTAQWYLQTSTKQRTTSDTEAVLGVKW